MSSRYLYRAPWEVEPRATASGTQNLVKLGAAVVNQRPYVPDYIIERGPSSGGPSICPAWGCEPVIPTRIYDPILRLPMGPTVMYFGSGATATTPQPPPPETPTGLYVTAQQTSTGSPQPAPVVSVPSSQTAPSLPNPGATLDASGNSPTVSTASGIGAWLEQSTLISGFPNWGIAAAGVLALMLFMGKKR